MVNSLRSQKNPLSCRVFREYGRAYTGKEVVRKIDSS